LYSSKFTTDALNDLKKLPKNVKNSLKKEFEKKIHVDPVGCSEPLTDPLEKYRSFHFGDYRVVYRVFENLRAVSVVGIGKKSKSHQTDLYEKLEKLARAGKLAESLLRSLAP
jgi:mRNA-degrading endonuclease RelE of RelBE toxin-antitoxin system